MKSAYELALERLEQRGIEPPREDALSDSVRESMAEARNQAQAKLAEIEILHRDKIATIHDLAGRQEEKEHYLLERQRIEARRDRAIEKLRQGESS